MEININCMCTVKLLEPGVKAINNQYAKVGMKPRKQYKVGDLYTSQLWCIMEIFGPFIMLGCNVPFETVIEIK